MSGSTELDQLHHLIGDVRQCVASLRSSYGDIAAMRRIVNDSDRLVNDVDRLDIDAGELDQYRASVDQRAAEKFAVSDMQYDPEFWRGIDDEGVGGQSGPR
ncbi:hypothetical protein [Mycolicibacterium moriokaense]|uniref:Uncharacterized protein n=1 Tax=Mycolicibacterium moriokaense TaxID=39691 RepID=A0A318H9Z4_9MYCO|nr:hypothetical protein [Mycolicibacterium moriokaense]PXW98888.1 hypothetical protein C8E89_14338 [Mycolicibacterium moriokaense]